MGGFGEKQTYGVGNGFLLMLSSPGKTATLYHKMESCDFE